MGQDIKHDSHTGEIRNNNEINHNAPNPLILLCGGTRSKSMGENRGGKYNATYQHYL